MKARRYLTGGLMLGTFVAALAPTANAARAGSSLGCATAVPTHKSVVRPPAMPSQAGRALQTLQLGTGALPIRTACSGKHSVVAVAGNHFQVLRNSL